MSTVTAASVKLTFHGRNSSVPAKQWLLQHWVTWSVLLTIPAPKAALSTLMGETSSIRLPEFTRRLLPDGLRCTDSLRGQEGYGQAEQFLTPCEGRVQGEPSIRALGKRVPVDVALWLVHAHKKPSQEQMSANGTGGSRTKHTALQQNSPLPTDRALGSPVAGTGLHFLTGFSYGTKRRSVEVDPTVQLAPTTQKTHPGCLARGRPVHDQAHTQLSLASGFFLPTSGGFCLFCLKPRGK